MDQFLHLMGAVSEHQRDRLKQAQNARLLYQAEQHRRQQRSVRVYTVQDLDKAGFWGRLWRKISALRFPLATPQG